MTPKTRTHALLLAGVILAADQWTKAWSLAHLPRVGGSQTLPGPVDLTLSLNHSNAFGLTPILGEVTRWGLTAFNLGVAAALLIFMFRERRRRLTTYGLALIAAGAVGNAIDRARLGAVVDFFDASKIGFVWIFNIADATVDAGIGLLLLSTFRDRDAAKV